MYAIVETGGKQYRVELGSELEVERLVADPGSEVVLDRVLLVADGERAAIGRPVVAGASVRASVVRQDRGPKIDVFKYKAKTRHRTKQGHRQELTVLRIADIVHDGRSAAASAAAEVKEAAAEREQATREATEQASRDAALAAELARRADEAREARAEATAKAPRARGEKAPAKSSVRRTRAAKAAPPEKGEMKKNETMQTEKKGRARRAKKEE